MHYVEIVTLASNAQMLSLNSDTCQVSDTHKCQSWEGVCTSTNTGASSLSLAESSTEQKFSS